MSSINFHAPFKQLVWDFWAECSDEDKANFPEYASSYVSPDVKWHGPHPFNDLVGLDAVIEQFCRPLMHALPDIVRNHDIFFGAEYEGNEWVSSTGHFTGTFANEWLGIPPTGKEVNIRFGEFCKVQSGRITEIYIIFDLLDLIHQAGYRLLPVSPGSEDHVPGPIENDGIITSPYRSDAARRSMQLVEDMIFDGLMQYDGKDLASMRMRDYWREDMIWYGPFGIGTSHGMADYEQNHATPFLTAFPDRKGGDHKARLADGNYVATTGWPSVRATHAGEWLGAAPTGKQIQMRVMDWWRRDDRLLTENWVLLDIPHIFLQFDIDLLGRFQEQLKRIA